MKAGSIIRLKMVKGILVLLLIAGCSDNNVDDRIPAELSTLTGNDFRLIVDRIAEAPDVHFPSDRLEEKDYSLYNGEKSYVVTFSVDGQRVSLDQSAISGTRKESGAGLLEYELSDSLFAGGRFLIWSNATRFEAELTIYGSGIPVLRSERGNLVHD